jgi:hypothetical protein
MHLYLNAKTADTKTNAQPIETSVIRDYESPRGCEQLAPGVLAVRLDLGKNDDQAIKETIL